VCSHACILSCQNPALTWHFVSAFSLLMNSTKVTIEVALKRELYEKLKQRAELMGFDSIQAYIRFWATAETNDVNHQGLSAYSDLSSRRAQTLRYFELLLAQCPAELSMQGYVHHVMQRIKLYEMDKMLKSLGMRSM
jgi:hypothetical protein